MTATSIEADRERVALAVSTTPGLTTREIAEALGMTIRHALTSLRYVERHGRVERWHDGLACRWFPPW